MYYDVTGARSCNRCCSGKAVIIAYSECVLVALRIQHATRMRHIVICGLSCTIFLHIISQNGKIFKKGKVYVQNRCSLLPSLQILSETQLLYQLLHIYKIHKIYTLKTLRHVLVLGPSSGIRIVLAKVTL